MSFVIVLEQVTPAEQAAFVRAAQAAGFTEFETFTQTYLRASLPAPIQIVPPPIIVPWWESLPEPMPGAPKRKIYSARDGVIVYRSERADLPPNETTGITNRRLARGQEQEVWHAPVKGSQWISTFDGNVAGAPRLVLWVKGGDMSPMKPA